jgi:hypothetical protein
MGDAAAGVESLGALDGDRRRLLLSGSLLSSLLAKFGLLLFVRGLGGLPYRKKLFAL